jgi:hypothetical protein
MSMGAQESREVPVDVLPPLPGDVGHPVSSTPTVNEPPLAGLKTFYHPASGIAILGIDFFIFGSELFSGFLDVPIMSVLAFLVTLPLVYKIQTKWSRDKASVAFAKAFAGAFMAGLPFSIAGTIYGAAVLALSGLPHHPVEMFKRLVSGQSLARPVK